MSADNSHHQPGGYHSECIHGVSVDRHCPDCVRSHSDQDIDRHNAERYATDCHACDGTGLVDHYYRYATDPCPKCDGTGKMPPAQVVTATGIQYMLPGESPVPAKKGADVDQTRMF